MNSEDREPARDERAPARRGWLRRLGARRVSASSTDLGLPAMSRGAQGFAMVMFFLLGVAVAAILIADPFGFRTADSSPVEMAMKPEAELAPVHYTCPMHPEVIEGEPGDCPLCGMALVPRSDAASSDRPAASEREILYWYAPMDPTYVRDEPGLSPMGMKLMPRYADETRNGGKVIRVDPVQVQNMGVVSVAASRSDIGRLIRTVGILDFNADLITWVNTKFSGWIEKVYVSYVGQNVKKGQALFEIYSPELVSTQEEYLRALEYKRSLENSSRSDAIRQAESLLTSTRDRLRYWDISLSQIEALEERRETHRTLTIASPVDGTIAEVMDETLEGIFVRPGMNLYKIADLSSVWVHADVYESDLPWIEEGRQAEISFPFDAQKTFKGAILFLYPEVSQETRTLKICVQVPNQSGQLRPGMYTDVEITGPPVRDAVVIPESSVLRSGERDLVFIDMGDGRFAPREIVVGIRGDGDQVQVIDGVLEGERVVTQAQFMLDSESRVQEAIAKFMERRGSGGEGASGTGAQPAEPR